MIKKIALLFLFALVLVVLTIRGVHVMFGNRIEGIKINNAEVRFLNGDSFLENRNNSIYDIDIFDNEIYIPDFRHNRVLIFDKDFNEIRRINNVPSPHSVTVDNDGSIYVATYRDSHIRKFDILGTEIENWDRELGSGLNKKGKGRQANLA